jgi:hypothetical protein
MRSCRVCSLACFLTLTVASMFANAQTSVPYVGGPGDGQTGPYVAAKGSPKPVKLPPSVANQLAWYEYKREAGQFGTLGPRDWNCFATIGSNGWSWSARLEMCQWIRETLDKESIWDEARSTNLSR